jgi:hypothetical protein
MEALRQDLCYGVRMLSRNPVFTVVVVVTLAIGIGLNTTLFSIVDGILFRPLPHERPNWLVGNALLCRRVPKLPASLVATISPGAQRNGRTNDYRFADRPAQL